tara:strand:- start:6710 stop:7081 length:372 start_codon:yes stop_codon:yes gene_type:complete
MSHSPTDSIATLREQLAAALTANQELEERVTCLESDSHNEVSQMEMDDAMEAAAVELATAKEIADEKHRMNQYYEDFISHMDAQSTFMDFVNKRSDTHGVELFCFEVDSDGEEDQRRFCHGDY